MKGLLLRLTSLDADAAAAVRVIAHFQALLGGRLDAATLLRSTAALAECPAGYEPADGPPLRFGPDGVERAGPPGVVSGAAGLRPAGRVWLERPGAPGPFDDLVLEWLAIAAGTLGGPSPVADPALVELALSARESDADRSRALRLLGLAPERPLRAVVVTDPARDPDMTALALLGRGRAPGHLRVARVGGLGVALLQGREDAGSPAAALREAVRGGARVGIGGPAPALGARVAWEQACVALRFTAGGTTAGDAVTDHGDLGPLALLADVPAARLREDPDTRALDALAAREGGDLNIAALAAFCRTGSLRQAAAELHLHHSSVAARLARVEAALGRRLHDPGDRFRAHLALYAWRLASAER
ncbi:helix-turn-helix domain-containing protein [Streptomyces sp. RFCAC02]|uniref:PucR family transcriptional regulator n=1 Tax=Streptomyces sp. RFCAC02 TaxID=2499143 RepID=UPI0010218B0C|nr:helix-turn-helix domain-containing protein [Streptomyces sp. RFCAC02]